MRPDRSRRERRSRRRRWLLGGAVLVLLLPVVVALEIAWVLSRPRLETDPPFRVDAVVGADRPGATFELRVLGDSTVAGVGVERAEETLPYQVAELVSERLGRPVHVVGHGVSGAITADVPGQLEDVPTGGVDAILVEVGSNDVLRRRTLNEVEDDTERVLDAAFARAPVVVLASAGKLNTPNFLQPLRSIITSRSTRVRGRQQLVAERRGAGFVDVAREVAPLFERAGDDANASDRFHPSALGYRLWAGPLAEQVVEEVAAERRSAG